MDRLCASAVQAAIKRNNDRVKGAPFSREKSTDLGNSGVLRGRQAHPLPTPRRGRRGRRACRCLRPPPRSAGRGARRCRGGCGGEGRMPRPGPCSPPVHAAPPHGGPALSGASEQHESLWVTSTVQGRERADMQDRPCVQSFCAITIIIEPHVKPKTCLCCQRGEGVSPETPARSLPSKMNDVIHVDYPS